MYKISVLVKHVYTELAPSQNRTDTRSLEGYCSTIELQARELSNIIEN